MKTEVTQAELEALEVKLHEAEFKYHSMVIASPELHLAYSQWRAAEKRVLEARRARREAEVHE